MTGLTEVSGEREAVGYAIGMRTRFRGIDTREGVLLRGAAGWGEFCPFDDYSDAAAVAWLRAAVEAADHGWPEPVRELVPVNCIVPVVSPERAYELVAASGCTTAKVKVADQRVDDRAAADAADEDRVRAARDALGPSGAIRIDANAAWEVDRAVRRIERLDRAAGGLEYVEQPCLTLEELAALRRRIEVRIAADESIRRADDPLLVAATRVGEAADVAVLKCAPLGGVRPALRIAEAVGLPCVVSSALETSVGLAAEIALAAALPELPFACGLSTLALLDGDVVAPGDELRPVDGVLRVPRTAPPPDPARLSTHPLGGDRVRYWTRRLAAVAAMDE